MLGTPRVWSVSWCLFFLLDFCEEIYSDGELSFVKSSIATSRAVVLISIGGGFYWEKSDLGLSAGSINLNSDFFELLLS